MKLVIDIPKHIYEHAKEQCEDNNDEWDAMRAIANGMPLPKEHGRIGDLDRLYNVFKKNVARADAFKELFDIAPTIIGAEDGGKE